MPGGIGHRIALRLLGRMPLGRLLALLFAGIVVVTAATVGAIHFHNSRSAVRGAIARMRRGAVARVAQHLDHFLSLPEQANAGNLVLARQGLLPAGDPDRLLRYFWEQGANFPGLGTIALADTDGNLFGANRPERYLVLADRSIAGAPIRRYAPDGNGLRSGQPLGERPGYDARQREWYRAAVAAGRPTWSAINVSVTRPRLDLTAASPWIDPAGALRGVFLVDVSLAQISDFLGEISRGRQGTIFVVERSGALVASSTTEPPFRVGDGEPARVERLRATASRSPVIAAAARLLLNGPRADLTDRELIFRVGGEPYVLAASRYSRGAAIDWLIASAIPESEYTGKIHAANRAAILLTVLAALGAIGLGTLTARWVVGPLLQLNAAAKGLAEGHWEIPVPAGRDDEVGALAASLAQMAARLQQLVVRLQSEVTERTRAEVALHQAQKMEAVGHLAGGIAHDFNNILTAIIGYASLLELGLPAGSPLRADAAHLLDAAEKAANLTQGLLAFSRRQVVAPRPLDLNEVIAGIAPMLQRLIGEEIVLRLELDARSLVVVADRGQLEQLVMNLVTNGRDAMPGGGTVTIATRAAAGTACPDGTGECAVITVADTGAGMDRRTMERIFEPFFTTKEAGKGTGLGLAVAYGIVTQHGGHVSCASEPGSGTTFTVVFPLAAADAAASAAPAQPNVEAAAPAGRLTILLVEDDPTVRAVTTSLLEAGGCTVIAAPDGEAGLALFREHQDRVDCVVTDLIMPGMDGKIFHDAVKRLRPDAKVLFVSGYAADLLSERGLVGPGVHFLAKPLRFEPLLRKIREALAG